MITVRRMNCHKPNHRRNILSAGRCCRSSLHFLVLAGDMGYGGTVKMHMEIVRKLTKNTKNFAKKHNFYVEFKKFN